MTQAGPPLARWIPYAPILLLASFLFIPLAAAADDAPADWVARVHTTQGDRYLTRDRLAEAVLWRMRAKFKDPRSGPLTIFKQLVQERVMEQEARRLGVTVGPEDFKREFDRLDKEVRNRTNGNRNLYDVIRKDMKISVEEFREKLGSHMLNQLVAGHAAWLGKLPKDRNVLLAQVEVVVGEILTKAKLEYGMPSALQDPHAKLPPGQVARVNGEPITARELGEALLKRLPPQTIKSVIQEECKSALTTDWALTPEQMKAVMDRERDEWIRVRELASQEAYHTLPYEEFVRLQYGLDLEHLQQDRYYRGLFGLVQNRREQVTDEEIRADWEKNRTSIYGDRYLVTDIQIVFSPRQKALLVQGAGRDYKEALRLSNGILRRIHSGAEPFDQVIRDINQVQDATFFAKRISVRNTDNERLLYDQAKLLQEGQVSRPFETLTEVHIIRFEGHRRAPTFGEVADTIRQRIAFQGAHQWLEEQMTNQEKVEIRWPPTAK